MPQRNKTLAVLEKMTTLLANTPVEGLSKDENDIISAAALLLASLVERDANDRVNIGTVRWAIRMATSVEQHLDSVEKRRA